MMEYEVVFGAREKNLFNLEYTAFHDPIFITCQPWNKEKGERMALLTGLITYLQVWSLTKGVEFLLILQVVWSKQGCMYVGG